VPHHHDVLVRWSDEDRLGHVNNTRYLTFTEDARLSWLSDSPTGSAAVILARTEIDFVRPVHFEVGGLLCIHTSVLGVGRSSVRLRQDIFHAADTTAAAPADRTQAVARTEHVLVCYDYGKQRSRPWREQERTWLLQWSAEAEST
jgi:acyl-CoA thioester hydrolase